MNEVKKMSLFSCVMMGIGSIIGASIFATTPIAIKIIGGNGIVLGFILAAIFVFLKTLPEMVLISVLPANGASYMHLTRLVHPYLGIIHAFNQLAIGPMKVATMALTFSTYFAMLFPSIPEVLVAVVITIIFTIITCYGIQISAWVQNVCVFVLLAAIGTYIFGGWGHTVVSLKEVITSTFELTKMWAAMGIMHGSLIGANALMYIADEIENPGKNIPIAFLISTFLTAIIYASMAYVTIGVMLDFYKIDNLATVAGKFMSPGMLTFFIAGGALLAVVTSINSCILMFSRSHFAAARDGLFPESIMKLNKYNAPANSIWLNSLIAILAMVFGFNLTDVINITSIPGLLLSPIIFASIFMLPKYFPNSYKTSFLRIPHWINCVIVFVASALCLVMGSSVLAQMKPKNYLLMVGFYIAAGTYTYFRIRYLKNKGVDMVQNMKTPYQPWLVREEAAKKELANKN
ncbi:amino acid permease [Tepidanaerobacter syntrophicus]|uniref:APC family permease n=1 Tax=Tepidanaerobacter syntrophicus TaxID=224999 RepID=UPI001777DBFE|nr:APC family permease [Tepidanaerobacter syntrophicus]GLI19430.1 amino acid permease [Tepidanaerobacter syntrophicus]GLI50538.1 amino acid permease [Tepidanaerobacter syntrophicus]HHY79194.1 APC family permease [Thermoanaerobacter sp.]